MRPASTQLEMSRSAGNRDLKIGQKGHDIFTGEDPKP
jgi:hypothetical protein